MEYKRPPMLDLFRCSKHGYTLLRVEKLPELGKDAYTHVCIKCDEEENIINGFLMKDTMIKAYCDWVAPVIEIDHKDNLVINTLITFHNVSDETHVIHDLTLFVNEMALPAELFFEYITGKKVDKDSDNFPFALKAGKAKTIGVQFRNDDEDFEWQDFPYNISLIGKIDGSEQKFFSTNINVTGKKLEKIEKWYNATACMWKDVGDDAVMIKIKTS